MATPIRLTKTDTSRRKEIIESSRDARSALEDAIAAYNRAVSEANSELSAAITAYNEHIEEVSGFAQDIATELREAYDERSESWKDSDAGHAANDFVETWENFSVDDFSVDQPEDVCAPDDDVADMLEELDDRP